MDKKRQIKKLEKRSGYATTSVWGLRGYNTTNNNNNTNTDD